MRRLVLLFLVVMAALAVAACMTSADVLSDRPWKLAQVGGVAPAAEGGLEFDVNGGFQVRTGCNSGGGTYAVKGDHIEFGVAGLTEMACPGGAGEQETAVLAVLASTPRFEIGTGTGVLKLIAPDGAMLQFVTP